MWTTLLDNERHIWELKILKDISYDTFFKRNFEKIIILRLNKSIYFMLINNTDAISFNIENINWRFFDDAFSCTTNMLDGDFTSVSIILMVLYLLAAPAALDSSDTRCATKGCPHLCPTQSYYCFLNGPLSFGSLGDKSLLEQDQFPFFDTRIQCGPHFSTMSDSFGNSKY